jgi:hypothetical protein
MTEALVVVGIVCFPGKGVNEKWQAGLRVDDYQRKQTKKAEPISDPASLFGNRSKTLFS